MRTPTRRRLAVLSGEEMLQFGRAGKTMFVFCPDCVHSAYTPVTQLLGCTAGDDAQVLAYSEQVKSGEADPDTEKCPGFSSRQSGDAAGPIDAVASKRPEAVMVKEVPSDEPDLSDGLVDGDDPTWSDAGQRGEIQALLADAGVRPVPPPGENSRRDFDLATQILTGWRGGVMAPHVTAELVHEVLRQYGAERAGA